MMDKDKQCDKFETAKRKTDNEGLRKSIEEKERILKGNKTVRK